ncbi:MAG: hypothetical protein KJ064_26820 [Anaerolineae bacterium]|nr:hypothetical protein [Anaerolineae bacterium]
MRQVAIVFLVTLLLLSCFGMTAFASYTGQGLTSVGPSPSLRMGSIGGPSIFGGGPGSGK